MSTVAVLGGGISGLSAAYYLSRVPAPNIGKIIVLEGSKRFGGWVNTTQYDDGSVFEHGPRSFLLKGRQGRNTLMLAEELGLGNKVVRVLKKNAASRNRFIYVNNRLHKLPNSFGSMLRKISPFSKPLIWSGLKDIITKKEKGIPDESLHSLVERRLGKEVADYLISAVCRGVYAGDTRLLSAKNCMPEFYRAVNEHGKIIRGMMMNPVKNDVEFLGEESDLGIERLVQRAMAERWSSWTFSGGQQTLTDRLVEVMEGDPRIELRIESPCSHLTFRDDCIQVRTSDGTEFTADHVISSVYSKDLAHLLPDQHSSLSSSLNRIPAVTCVVVNLEFPGKQPLEMGFGHLLPAMEDGPILGVVYDSNSYPMHNRIDKPTTRLTLMLGGHWFEELKERIGSLDDDAVTEFSLDTLKQQLNITDKPLKSIVSIQKDCIPQYYVGHSDVVDDISQYIDSHRLPLTLIGSSYKGVSVNDCIMNAKSAADRILAKMTVKSAMKHRERISA